MKKKYDPFSIEPHWSQYWEQHRIAHPSGTGSPYCIVLPPPNVTGTLHMGHGFQHTLMDALIRRKRMQNYNTLWQGGTDHAGIATQIVVERQLAQEGLTRTDLGRERFIERVWQWKEKSGSIITRQIRRLGASIDWSREKFSMDETITQATVTAFRQLYHQGLIYRGQRLVNWDPILGTALADLEVENIEVPGFLWHIHYPLEGKAGSLIVATTRPETLFGDTAIAVHPHDERYLHLIGKKAKVPLTDRLIPIIADEQVDRQFGTGCLKITPGHDFNDYEIGQRHQLPVLTLFTLDGRLNDQVPPPYQGLSALAAREKVVEHLKAAGLLARIEPHTQRVPHGDRSGAVIQPMLTDQWFIKMKPLALLAIEAVQQKKLKFIPSNWTKVYLQWLENIQDWCISRQLWWGHRIPVWYDPEGHVYIGSDEKEVRTEYRLPPLLPLKQDEDVLDTWFTAALWPFSSLDWPEDTADFNTFYPTNVLVTGFDILFFWVARMVMMGVHLTGKVPFKTVYVTGLVRDRQGQKMSKSKGNILDPIDLIDGIDLEKLVKKRTSALIQPQMARSIEQNTRKEFPNGIPAHGTDALRFTFCALATTGRDLNFDMGRIHGYRNFCNKLWNAARYVLMNTTEEVIYPSEAMPYSLADRWILSRLQTTLRTVNQHFNRYRFDLIAKDLYEFTWNEYCDWYLEFSKSDLNNPALSDAQLQATRYTLLNVLETLLRLLHPIMPFITEEIWQNVAPLLARSGPSIALAPYPESNPALQDPLAEEEVAWLQAIVTQIRTLRSEMNLPPALKIPLLVERSSATDKQRLIQLQDLLQSLTHVAAPTWPDDSSLNATEPLPPGAKIVVGTLELCIPFSGLVDPKAELDRLRKTIQKFKKQQEKSLQKLNNPQFIQKAPASVIEQEQQRLQAFERTLQKLEAHCQRIAKMECEQK